MGGRFLTYERQKVRRQEGERGEKTELPHDARLPCNSLSVDVIETSQFLWSQKQPQTTPSFLPPLYRSHRSSYYSTKATAALATAFSHESIRREKGGKRLKREPRAKYDPVGRSVADTDDSCSDDGGGGAEVGHPRKYLEHAKLGTDLL